MRVLFDTNVLLDALLAREPFVGNAASLLEAIESGQIEGFMSATTARDVDGFRDSHISALSPRELRNRLV
jgi:predicted nucleic acid-binding protein